MRAILALMLATTVAHADDQGRADVDAREAICRPYANALLRNQMQWMFDRALNHCLNLLDYRPQPPERGDWRGALDILDPDRAPDVGPSGYAPDTPGWMAWCRRVWPQSFDGSTVIFEANGKGRRARCPG